MDRYSELFERFFGGKATPEDEKALLHLISDGEEGLFEDYCRSKWDSASDEISEKLRLRVKSKLLKTISYKDSCRGRMRLTPRVKRFAYTAVAALILALTLHAGCYIAQYRSLDVIETITEAGQKSHIILPDGSRPSDSGSIPATTYIGNKNSKKLHLPGCSSLPGEENRVTFEDYDKAISEGYTPCSKCLG